MLDPEEEPFFAATWEHLPTTEQGLVAQRVFEEFAPAKVAEMSDPARYFRLLGAVLAAKISYLGASMTAERCSRDKITDSATRTGVANVARLDATELVMAEHVYCLVPSSTD